MAAEGYAVFSCYAGTSKFSNFGNSYGTPTQVAAYTSGYNWVLKNYNIKTDGVFAYCKSWGGFPMQTLMWGDYGIPAKALGFMSPLLSNQWTGTNTEKLAIMSDFGFTEDVGDLFLNHTHGRGWFSEGLVEYLLVNKDKIVGYKPDWTAVVDYTIEQLIKSLGSLANPSIYDSAPITRRLCKAPVKIWGALDDIVSVDAFYLFRRHIINAGGRAEIRMFPINSGKHNAVDYAGPSIDIKTKYGGLIEGVPVAYAELVSFFKRFE